MGFWRKFVSIIILSNSCPDVIAGAAEVLTEKWLCRSSKCKFYQNILLYEHDVYYNTSGQRLWLTLLRDVLDLFVCMWHDYDFDGWPLAAFLSFSRMLSYLSLSLSLFLSLINKYIHKENPCKYHFNFCSAHKYIVHTNVYAIIASVIGSSYAHQVFKAKTKTNAIGWDLRLFDTRSHNVIKKHYFQFDLAASKRGTSRYGEPTNGNRRETESGTSKQRETVAQCMLFNSTKIKPAQSVWWMTINWLCVCKSSVGEHNFSSSAEISLIGKLTTKRFASCSFGTFLFVHLEFMVSCRGTRSPMAYQKQISC